MPSSLQRTMTSLDTFLCSCTVSVATSLSRITSTSVSNQVTKEGWKRFVQAYGKLYQRVRDPKEKYEFIETLMGRTVEEVETLVCIDEN